MSASPIDEPLVLRSDAGGVATLTLNRPRAMNLLSSEMLATLQSHLDRVAADPQVRVVVLAATGRGFSAGHDLREIRALAEPAAIERLFRQCSRLMESIVGLPQPVLARVQGVAAAAGCQLVAQCDLAVASTEAEFTTPGVTWGFFCSTPGVAIGRTLPRKRALEMLLGGETIDAPTAAAWGLVNRVAPPDELNEVVAEWARRLAAKPPHTLARGKRAFYAQMELGLAAAYERASRAIACDFASPEGREGMNAFLEKRSPRWPT